MWTKQETSEDGCTFSRVPYQGFYIKWICENVVNINMNEFGDNGTYWSCLKCSSGLCEVYQSEGKIISIKL